MRAACRPTALAAPWVIALGALSASQVQAAAFQLQEQSASLLGSAFAGRSADAADVSHMFFNPASLAAQSGRGPEASVVLSRIDPTFDYASDNPVAAESTLPGSRTSAAGGESATVPVAYGAVDLAPDVRAGLGINVPYGLETDYPDDWVGRYDAVHTEVLTVDINPAVAWQYNEEWAVGAGISAQYAEADLSTMLPNDPTEGPWGLGEPAPAPETDAKVEVEGDDWSYGFNLGARYEPDADTRVGVAYRHGMGHTLTGDATLTHDGRELASTGGEADLDLPATVHLGLSRDVHPDWTLLLDASWTQWSDFEELRIEFDEDIGLGPAQEDEYDWDDTWFLSLGTRFDASEQWDLRAGIAYDETPVGREHRTPRIPDSDRTWLALGATWQPQALERLTVDVGYTYIWLDDADITLAKDLPDQLQVDEVDGEYESSVQVLTTGASWRF